MAFAATVSEAAVMDPMGSGCGVGAGGTEDGCDGTGSLLVEEMIVLKLAAPQPGEDRAGSHSGEILEYLAAREACNRGMRAHRIFLETA